MSKGYRGTAKPSPCINILSAVARWLHGSEDSMSWITQRSELCNSVSQFLQNCSTPFSSSQSGKANCESAAPGGIIWKKDFLSFSYSPQPLNKSLYSRHNSPIVSTIPNNVNITFKIKIVVIKICSIFYTSIPVIFLSFFLFSFSVKKTGRYINNGY